MKKQRKIEKDNRGVAIYARKSRITNKGDSIGVQFKQCADYAKKELGVDEEYEFLQYEDKGLSGYFSDSNTTFFVSNAGIYKVDQSAGNSGFCHDISGQYEERNCQKKELTDSRIHICRNNSKGST